jgi:uncharacterized Tic20 family protein
MYYTLLILHSIFRWLVLLSLLYCICFSIYGWRKNSVFSTWHNFMRHTTATISHVQLVIGYLIYFNSPTVTYFRQYYNEAVRQFEYLFFGLIHVIMMTISVILITIGSSVAKRSSTDKGKFRVIALFCSFALLIILIAIPWPFSPLARRPYIRTF